MGVMMQTFYWDCPKWEQKVSGWWSEVESKIPQLKEAGFTALWTPPASKAGNVGGMSMGYDVYDYFDLGEHNQKGSVKTWFGSKEELQSLIKTAHSNGISVYADVILNHNNGADAQETNPITGATRWTKFTPKSGRFPRDWSCFNPSPYDPYGSFVSFGEMPDLCHINPKASSGILDYTRWLVEAIGFDGFRYDFVKGFSGWVVRAIHDTEYKRGGNPVPIFGVGECWDSDFSIDGWLDGVNNFAIHRVGAFDFPMRYRLKDMCDSYGFSLRNLAEPGTLVKDRPWDAVTFVDNHDFRDSNPEIQQDKMMAYAVILTHEGYPCVYWKDYFTYDLALPGQPSGIDALVDAHEKYAGGTSTHLYVDDNFYVLQRNGFGTQPGLVMALNNSGGHTSTWVKTQWANRTLKPIAWRGKYTTAAPVQVKTNDQGWAEIEAGPRGYTVYAPK